MIVKKGTLLCLLVGLLGLPTGWTPAEDNWDASGTRDDSSDTKNALIPGDPAHRHDVEPTGDVADEDWFKGGLAIWPALTVHLG